MRIMKGRKAKQAKHAEQNSALTSEQLGVPMTPQMKSVCDRLELATNLLQDRGDFGDDWRPALCIGVLATRYIFGSERCPTDFRPGDVVLRADQLLGYIQDLVPEFRLALECVKEPLSKLEMMGVVQLLKSRPVNVIAEVQWESPALGTVRTSRMMESEELTIRFCPARILELAAQEAEPNPQERFQELFEEAA